MSFQGCSVTLANIGTPDCQPIGGVTKKLIIVPLFADDGTRNGIAIGDFVEGVLPAEFVTGKVNQADVSKRWFPTPFVDNVEDVRGEAVLETLNSGQQIFIHDGARSFTGLFVKQSTTWLSKLKSFCNANFGVYVVDKNGAIQGSLSAGGTVLYPIAVNAATWYPIVVKTTDTTIQKVQLKFEYADTELDENLRQIDAVEIESNMLMVSGLLDINMATANPTLDTVTVTATLDYGTFATKQPVKGLVAADFVFYNVTDESSVTVSSATEVSDGVYDIAFTSQTEGDTIRITTDKDGFEAVAATFVTVD